MFEELFGEKLWASDAEQDVIAILSKKRLTARDRAKELEAHLNNKRSVTKKICSMLVGNKANFKDLFPEIMEHASEEEKKESVNFRKTNYEEQDQDLFASLLGEYKDLLDRAYDVYRAQILQMLLSKEGGGRYPSVAAARMAVYDKHKADLNALKKVVARIQAQDPDKGLEIKRALFRRNEKSLNNYVAYSGHADSKNKQSPLNRCTQDEFSAYVRKLLEDYRDVEGVEAILEAIQYEQFMPRIRSTDNGVIPHQLIAAELRAILNNASTYLAFLTDDVIDEIMQIFNFRIPYYVGPLDDRSEEFAWIKRRSYEKIKPWNFDEIVDIPETANRFIRRMTNTCTYLIGEDVLPKESLLYSEYMVRNALNTLTVAGERLDHDIRERLYEDLFLHPNRSGKVTRNVILRALKSYGLDISNGALGGMDQEIPARLKARNQFDNILEAGTLTDAELERIIEQITVFPESKEMIAKWLNEEFGDRLTKEQIRRISSLTFKDWGRLSRKFLAGRFCDDGTGSKQSVIELLRAEPMNLMEILYDKRFNLIDQLNRMNSALMPQEGVITDEYLEQLSLSPPVHKAVRQSLFLVRELIGIMGGAPEKIFIEVARDANAPKTRTVTRKKRLEALYKNIKSESHLWEDELEHRDEGEFNSKVLYLYALQQGRCLYSGEPIDASDLFDKNKYDIDHIYPRSKTKDDSWDNLALVKQELNRMKSDRYPLLESFQRTCHAFWKQLLDQKFMSVEKYRRLTRVDPLTADELESFINRQLIETRQGIKVVADLFKGILKQSEVVYVKAGLVNDFRYRDGLEVKAMTPFEFPKVRELNDFHHAKDAYLNIVVGNVYHSKFTKRFYLNFAADRRQYNLARMYEREIKDAWLPGDDGTIATVKKMMNRNDVLLSFEAKRKRGGFFAQMIVKKGSGQYPIKTSIPALADFSRYGGFNKVGISHFAIIEYKKRHNKICTLAPIPVFLNKEKFDDEAVLRYLKESGYEEATILAPEVKVGGIIEVNGAAYRIRGKTNNNILFALPFQPFYNLDIEWLFKKLERYLKTEKIRIDDQEAFDEQMLYIYEMMLDKMSNNPFNNYSAIRNQFDILEKGVAEFIKLSLENKANILFSMASLLKGSGVTVDLSPIYEKLDVSSSGKRSGLFSRPMKFDQTDNIRVVDVSISGYYRNVKEIR